MTEEEAYLLGFDWAMLINAAHADNIQAARLREEIAYMAIDHATDHPDFMDQLVTMWRERNTD